MKPLIGYFADWVGYRAHFMVAACICVFGFLGILLYYPCDVGPPTYGKCLTPVIFGYVLFALSASLVGVYYSCLGLVVSPSILGTATGIVLSIGSGIGAV